MDKICHLMTKLMIRILVYLVPRIHIFIIA